MLIMYLSKMLCKNKYYMSSPNKHNKYISMYADYCNGIPRGYQLFY